MWVVRRRQSARRYLAQGRSCFVLVRPVVCTQPSSFSLCWLCGGGSCQQFVLMSPPDTRPVAGVAPSPFRPRGGDVAAQPVVHPPCHTLSPTHRTQVYEVLYCRVLVECCDSGGFTSRTATPGMFSPRRPTCPPPARRLGLRSGHNPKPAPLVWMSTTAATEEQTREEGKKYDCNGSSHGKRRARTQQENTKTVRRAAQTEERD